MKNFSGITDNFDVTTKKYVDDGLAEKANSADLATVATSGSYDDLENKPTNYVTTNTTQTISGSKTFTAQPIINTSDGLKFVSGNCALRIYNTSASPTDYSAIEVRSNSSSTNRNLFIDLANNSLVVGQASGTPDTTYKVNVKDSFNATTISENGTPLSNKYLGKTAKAADADKLDGNDSSYYLNYDNLSNKPSNATTSSAGLMSASDKTKLDGIATGANGTITGINMNGASKGTSGVVDLGTVLTDASKFATSAQGTKADNALSLDGGTIKKSKTIKMDASANSNGANLKWGTVNSKNPYIGYASDQVDGTFVIGSLLGTNYASGLAIGGGSGNLLWKGAKVATTNDIPPKVTESTVSGWGFTKNKGTVTQVKINGTTNSPDSAGLVDLGTISGGSTDNSKHGYTQLTNENLNTITEVGWYRAESGNTCTNRPSEISNNGFFLNVEKLNDTHVKQEIYVGLDYVSSYTRDGQSAYSGGTLDWSGWSSNMKISGFAQTFSGRKAFSSGINLINSLQVGGSNGATGQFLMSQGGSTPKWSSIQVKVNGTVYTIDSDGLIDLGTIGGTTTYTSMGNDIY